MCQPASNKSILSKCFFIEGLREIKLAVSLRAGQKMLIRDSDEGGPRDHFKKKMNLYFTLEFRSCADLLSAPLALRTYSSYMCNASVVFQIKIRNISRRRSRSPK